MGCWSTARILAWLLCATAGAACAEPAGLREACRQFVEQAEVVRPLHWGDYLNWTVVRNDDQSYSVGARFAAAGRERYTVCLVRYERRAFVLDKLVRLR